ncbi:hypothetical protein like AT2G34340 [Hibiscus trionum]|uniref:Senescence regulator n=1 Tax=Hibiscus trionum TaxID=183268 RepID=A0A9W7H9R5_HIBTR|nr:hypothetical protein like AT2G34340 [Hibiscus trionum]
MAEEEFQESEVLFSDQTSNHNGTHDEAAVKDDDVCFDNPGSSRSYKSDKTTNNKKKTVAISLPLNIQRHHGGAAFRCGGEGVEFEEYEDVEMEPPHVVLARRIAGKMAFSVCTGNGRTLKGRDLSQVRNSVLRMTGFLEA